MFVDGNEHCGLLVDELRHGEVMINGACHIGGVCETTPPDNGLTMFPFSNHVSALDPPASDTESENYIAVRRVSTNTLGDAENSIEMLQIAIYVTGESYNFNANTPVTFSLKFRDASPLSGVTAAVGLAVGTEPAAILIGDGAEAVGATIASGTANASGDAVLTGTTVLGSASLSSFSTPAGTWLMFSVNCYLATLILDSPQTWYRFGVGEMVPENAVWMTQEAINESGVFKNLRR